MSRFSREEVDLAFQEFFHVGCVAEDWVRWARMFTQDCHYVEHFWGTLHGSRQVEAWIEPVMAGVPEIYTVLNWYMVDGDRVVWHMENRRDNPDPDGPPYLDFAGLSVAQYAGEGRWCYEEDYWDVKGARRTARAYEEALRKTGATYEDRLTRDHWPDGPAFARTDAKPRPSWLGRDVPRITKPHELREILAGLD